MTRIFRHTMSALAVLALVFAGSPVSAQKADKIDILSFSWGTVANFDSPPSRC